MVHEKSSTTGYPIVISPNNRDIVPSGATDSTVSLKPQTPNTQRQTAMSILSCISKVHM